MRTAFAGIAGLAAWIGPLVYNMCVPASIDISIPPSNDVSRALEYIHDERIVIVSYRRIRNYEWNEWIELAVGILLPSVDMKRVPNDTVKRRRNKPAIKEARIALAGFRATEAARNASDWVVLNQPPDEASPLGSSIPIELTVCDV